MSKTVYIRKIIFADGHIYTLVPFFIETNYIALINELNFVVQVTHDELDEKYIKLKITSKLTKH